MATRCWRLVAALTIALVAPLGLWLLPLSADAAQPAAPRDLGAPPDVVALDDDWIDTPTGPLGPADRDLLVRVRTAGLWEGPAGEMAMERGAATRVKEVGHQLHADHTALDVQVRLVASELGVALPDEPTAEQQGWLQELASHRGAQFDAIFVDRLRAAHGKVFAVIAAVRAGTRNDTMREFAQTANAVVLKHITLLESTGLVDYDTLPTAAAPPPPPGSRPTAGKVNPSLVWVVLGLAGIVGLVTATRLVRPR